MTVNGISESVRLLLNRSVDYAGLFPPASLPMDRAARNYAAYRAGPYEWMLGRFVVPAARTKELQAAAADHAFADPPWPLTVLVTDAFAPVPSGPRVKVSSLELKIGEAGEIDRVGPALGRNAAAVYCEVPIESDAHEFASAAARAGVQLKARTGGTTAGAFPTAEELADFMCACVRRDVAFKLTAGLHHAIRGEYRLTYEPESPCGTMFGFLNVFLAAALCVAGGDDARMVSLLTETDADAVGFEDDGVTWREVRLDLATIRRTRKLFHAFGSCSFEEPVQELTAMGLMR